MSGLLESLNLTAGLIAIIGSGGKTSAMNKLADGLPGRIIITTTTHIMPPENIQVYTGNDRDKLAVILMKDSPVCAGTPDGPKLATPGLSMDDMKAVSDYVLVEADGSKGLPLKAHGSHEPVVPEDTDHLIWVVGASGFGRPAGEVLHRPEHFITEAGRSIDADVIVSPEMYAYHMARETERLAKSRGNWKRLTVLINQVNRSNDETADKARRFASVYRNSCQYNGAMSILTGSLRADHFYIL